MRTVTPAQARRYILLWQGLLGGHKFKGKEGVLQFVRQAGCVQFDPIDVCGRSPELTFHARVKGYQKSMLDELLYQDRLLLDYFDKNLAIVPMDDWPLFVRERAAYGGWSRSKQEIAKVREELKTILREKGPCCAADLPFQQKVDWYWNASTLARAALESLYFQGELVIHHKKGTLKYYDLAERCVPAHLLAAPDPYPAPEAHSRILALRRIRAVGILWNRASDAWLGVPDFKGANRAAAFAEWEKTGAILPIRIEGLKDTFYIPAEGQETLERACSGSAFTPRCEVIAPLDSFMWDRRLIEALFGFTYRWEIYTPVEKRQYGYYVLPLLRGDKLIGRVEAVREEKALFLKNIWLEKSSALSPAARQDVEKCLHRLAALNDLNAVRGLE